MNAKQIPVLAGVAQLSDRESDPRVAMTPLDMLERVARGACEDAGLGQKLYNKIDTIGIVSTDDWKPSNAVALLAERIGAKPSCMLRTLLYGGDTPLVIVNDIARRIETGQTHIALIAGSRNYKTFLRAKKEKTALQWELGGAGQPELVGKARQVFEDLTERWSCFWDQTGAIGRRYRRMDAIGTPYCMTIDHQTLQDNTVTIRYRDTMLQERIPSDKIAEIVNKKLKPESVYCFAAKNKQH